MAKRLVMELFSGRTYLTRKSLPYMELKQNIIWVKLASISLSLQTYILIFKDSTKGAKF